MTTLPTPFQPICYGNHIVGIYQHPAGSGPHSAGIVTHFLDQGFHQLIYCRHERLLSVRAFQQLQQAA
jgi:hypothetical protein